MPIYLLCFAILPHSIQAIAFLVTLLGIKSLRVENAIIGLALCIPLSILSWKLSFILFTYFFAKNSSHLVLQRSVSIYIVMTVITIYLVDQVFVFGYSQELALYIDGPLNHGPGFANRPGGAQLSPNYFALTLYLVLLSLYPTGVAIDRKSGLYFGALLAVLLSGSKSGLIMVLSLLRFSKFKLSIIILAALVFLYFSFFLPRLLDNNYHWFTVSNRIDGYIAAFQFSTWENLLFGHDVTEYDSAFDSTWSLLFFDLGSLGIAVVGWLTYKILKEMRGKLGILPPLILLFASFLHPIFYHVTITPMLILGVFSYQNRS